MSKRPTMTPAMLERVAEQFRALSEPSRLALMAELFLGERNVSELVAATGLSPTSASTSACCIRPVGCSAARTVCTSSTRSPTSAHKGCAT